MKNGISILEEYLQQFYIEHFEDFSENSNKVETLANHPIAGNWFYKTSSGYVVDGNQKKHYFLIPENLPQEVQDALNGVGTNVGKTLGDYIKGNDVLGVTPDLKVYYSKANFENMMGASYNQIDSENVGKVVFERGGPWAKLLSGDEEVTEITLKDVKNITQLTIDGNSGISSLAQLYNLTSLKYLTIRNVSMSLSGLENVPDLMELYLDNCTITDYSPVSRLTNLNWLYMKRNGATEEIDNKEVSGLLKAMKGVNYPNLNYFGIFGYDLTNVYTTSNSYFSNASADYSRVTDISDFENFTSTTKEAIKYLYLNNNKITDLSVFASCKNLYLVRIDGTDIKNLDFLLQSSSNLTYLSLQKTLVEDITVFSRASFSNLELIKMNQNASLENIDSINDLGSKLIYLYLSGTTSFLTSSVENIADKYNSIEVKEIDSYYIPYLQGSTQRVYSSAGLTDSSDEINNMLNMSAENKLKIKKIKLYNNPLLTDSKLSTVLGSGFTNCLALDLRKCTLLTNLDFLQYMPNLNELLIDETSVSGNEVENIDLYCTKLRGYSIKGLNVNLQKMQVTLSRPDGASTYAQYTEIRYGATGLDTKQIKQLSLCRDLTALRIFSGSSDEEIEVDLSLATGIRSCSIRNVTNIKFVLPNGTTSLSMQSAPLPDMSNCANTIQTIAFNYILDLGVKETFPDFFSQVSESTSLDSVSFTVRTFKGDPEKEMILDYSFLNCLAKSNIRWIKIDWNSGDIVRGLEGLDFTKSASYVTGTRHFNNLQSVEIGHGTLTNLNAFKDCTNLTSLSVTNCNISDINGVKNLTNLKKLSLTGNNNIKNLKALSNLTKLETLELNNNSVYSKIWDDELEDYYDNVALIKSLNSQKLTEIHLLNNKIESDDLAMLRGLTWTKKEL